MTLRKSKPIPAGTEPTENIAHIKRRIKATRSSKADLDAIVKSGAVRGASLDALLDLLARAVAPQETSRRGPRASAATGKHRRSGPNRHAPCGAYSQRPVLSPAPLFTIRWEGR